MFDEYKMLFEIAKCVKFGEFELSSGRISPYKIDIDVLTDYKNGLKFLAGQMIGFSRHSGFKPDYFVGIPSGTTMLAQEMTNAIDYIPDSAKKNVWREKNNREYQGPIEKDDKIVVIEDVVTSGKSLEYEVQNLKWNGADVIGAISIVDRLESKEEFDFPYNSAITIDHLLKYVEIPEEHEKAMKEYMDCYVKQIA